MDPFTIKTFYPTGNPNGFRIAEFTNSTILAIYIPKKELISVVDDTEALSWNGVYTLFDNNPAQKAYIGAAENIGSRLKNHLDNDWWKIAVTFVVNSENHQFSINEIKYLESLMYQNTKNNENIDLKNLNTPHKSYVEESRKFDLKNNFKDIKILLNSFGFPLFEKQVFNDNEETNFIYLNKRNAAAKAIYSENGKNITVLKNSKISNLPPTYSFNYRDKLNQLVDSGIIINNIFTANYQFSSLSKAADVICKSNLSGPMVWHKKDGQSIKNSSHKKW